MEKFYEANGHSRVNSKHKTEDGFSLGQWVSSQRNIKDSLIQEKIDRLDELGFYWDVLDTKWEEAYSKLKLFYEKNGHSRVKSIYKTNDEFSLGQWVSNQRKNKDSLIQERIVRLNELGFD